MIVRAAGPQDAAGICAVLNPIIRDTLVTFAQDERTPDSVAGQIARSGPAFLVAERHGRIVGFAVLAPFRPGAGYARTCEQTIHLAPDARGQGLGRQMVRRLESVARARSIHAVVAAISAANPGAIAFHTRQGFAEVGRMPEVGHKQGRWLDLVLMQKLLGPEQGQDGAPDIDAPAV